MTHFPHLEAWAQKRGFKYSEQPHRQRVDFERDRGDGSTYLNGDTLEDLAKAAGVPMSEIEIAVFWTLDDTGLCVHVHGLCFPGWDHYPPGKKPSFVGLICKAAALAAWMSIKK